MDKIDLAASELREMDDLAALSSPIHSLHPLSKLVLTVAYSLLTVSFHKYDLSGLVVMLIFPLIAYSLSGIPVRTCFRKLRTVLPLVLMVGLFNPFFDRVPLFTIGGVYVSGGVVSMVTLMLKGLLCLMTAFLLAATTPMDSLCGALRKIRVPKLFVTLLLLTFRYISVLVDEAHIMTTAYRLRAPGQRGIHYSAWGSFLGQLLLRSMDRAEELYSSMQLRGFNGEFYYAEVTPLKTRDYLLTGLAIGAFVFCRLVNIAALLGSIALGGF